MIWFDSIKTLFPSSSRIYLEDHFVTGINTNGTVGALGWVVNGGATSAQSSVTSHLGIIRKDTSAVGSTVAQLSLYSGSAAIDPALTTSITFVVRANHNDSDTAIRVGAGNALTTDPPTHGIYFEKLITDTNWFCVTNASGSTTRTDSGVAVSTGWVKLNFRRSSSGVQFMINGTVVGMNTATIPTTFINPGVQIVNNVASSKTLDVDYFSLMVTGL